MMSIEEYDWQIKKKNCCEKFFIQIVIFFIYVVAIAQPQ